VRRPHGAHAVAVVGAVEPADELVADAAAEHAAAFQPHALAGDDQHDPQVARRRVLEEARHRPLGGRDGHAVQVERGLRHELAARQRARDVAVEGTVLDRQLGPGRRCGRLRPGRGEPGREFLRRRLRPRGGRGRRGRALLRHRRQARGTLADAKRLHVRHRRGKEVGVLDHGCFV